MLETFSQTLPNGTTLACRASGTRGRPVLLFLHGFPEGAFVWDALLQHFSRPENGGWRCVAPFLRGFSPSSQPAEVEAYRARLLVQDLQQLLALESPTAPLGALVAHDWGGAVAWAWANQQPEAMQRLLILNSPHPGTFLRELRDNPAQQAASAYMAFLARPDAEALLAEDDFERLWGFLRPADSPQDPPWLTPALKDQYREVWRAGLRGGCNYYRVTPLRPGQADALTLPDSLLRIEVPTRVLWGLQDHALLPGLLEGLEQWVPHLELYRHGQASHWIVHEDPDWVCAQLQDFLRTPPPQR
ncbi:MAG: alpha/beta fold hydrolase [Curvibacter sp.]|nr:alpha/beta fold hydrolase [Curvibacter sp.]